MPALLKRGLLKIVSPELYSRVASALAPRIRATSFRLCRSLVAHRRGFEVGGPSGIFSAGGALPLYGVVARVDNCNFSTSTTWEGSLTEGLNFRFNPDGSPGFQYIREATDLWGIASEEYDFLLSSHNIEHLANPLRALKEWQRIVRPGGVLVLVVPHREATFDHRRPVTGLAHFRDDYERDVQEDDMTHLEEVLELHDLTRDPGSADYREFRERSLRNVENRCLHHHVFDTATVIGLLDYAGLQLLEVEPLKPAEIIVTARKCLHGARPDNARFLSESAEYRRSSPFAGDRRSGVS